MTQNKQWLIDVEATIKEKSPKLWKKIPTFAFRRLEKMICQEPMNDFLRLHGHNEGVEFAEALLEYFRIGVEIHGLENLPKDQRFTFASNHPLGGLDGVAMVAVLGRYYDSRIKFIVNDLLMAVRGLRPVFLPINKFGSQAKETTDAVNKAYMSDDQMIIFPAGLCSRLQKNGEIRDLEWKKAFIVKSVQSQRDVVPVYIEARNSPAFYRIAKWRKKLGLKFNLELIRLPKEMFISMGQTFVFHFGTPIPYTRFDQSKTPAEWAEVVKEEVYKLKELKS